MSLADVIDERLWSAVRTAYNAGNYSAAIGDAILFLSDLIRDKSGEDSDGQALIGSVFGGPNPIIKINLMRTQSERDEQKGVEQLLRGVYTAIRNPRSHEKRPDSVETANVLIAFIGWLTGLIDQSKSLIDTQQIIEEILDRHFPEHDRYVELLIERIPKRKRLDILIEVLQRRAEGNWRCLRLFTRSTLQTLPQQEQDRFWQILSEDLQKSNTETQLRTAVQIAKDDWAKVSESARIRTENRMIQSVRQGEYDPAQESTRLGSLGTWLTHIADYMILQDQLIAAIQSRLLSDDPYARAYAFKYHFWLLIRLRPKPPLGLVRSLRRRLVDEQDREVYDALIWVTVNLGSAETDEWVAAFKESVLGFQSSLPSMITDDDIPF